MTAHAIEARHLEVWLGDRPVLDDISIEVPAGTFTAIIGPNGAGKSTFLRTLLGLIRPTRGVIHVLGETPGHVLPRSVGYVPQVKTLDRSFPAHVVELVVSGLRLRWPWRPRPHERAEAEQALARVGGADLADRPLAALSQGELQRVYLARSLVRKPQLILLDEPAAGMDIAAEADMYHILESYPAQTGATVLMVTHDWEGARYHASHVMLMHRRLIAFGPPAEVLEKQQLGEAYGHSRLDHAYRAHRGGT